MVDQFIEALKREASDNVFNPWFEVDEAHEMGQSGPKIRRSQLKQYLSERYQADYVLLGEALGYQGGHFTGIAMTSERILLGKMAQHQIFPDDVFRGLCPERTSKPSIKPEGFSEPTATIVWGLLNRENLDTRKFILWNAFPWRPYHPSKGRLSNRTPTRTELGEGGHLLKKLLSFIQPKKVIAVGNKAATQLKTLGIETQKVRHPAYGGASAFCSGLLREIEHKMEGRS